MDAPVRVVCGLGAARGAAVVVMLPCRAAAAAAGA